MPSGVYERTPEMVARNSAFRAGVIRKVLADWKQTRDEPLQHYCGVKSSSIVRRCDTCKRVIRGPAFFSHQKAKQHTGTTILKETDE